MIPHNLIRSALRRIWQWGPTWKAAKRAAKRGPNLYQCAGCTFTFKTGEVNVDHVVECGPTPGSRNAKPGTTWDEFIRRMFCPVEGLRVLCVFCHAKRKSSGQMGQNPPNLPQIPLEDETA